MDRELARLELEHVFQEFKKLPFPTPGRSKETQDIHGVLIQYDADVAATVPRILESPTISPLFIYLSGIQADLALKILIDNLVEKYPPDHEIGRAAREYANYYEMILKVIRSAHSYLDSSH